MSEPKSKSRAGGNHYLSSASTDPNKAHLKQPPLNWPVHVKCTTMINLLVSAMKAELGAPFVNCQRGAAMCMLLIDIGKNQPQTPEVTDSATGDRFFNKNLHQWCSRAIDIRFYWVRDWVSQENFLIYAMVGEHNLTEYFTMQHPTSHHRSQRSTYIVLIADGSNYAWYMSPSDLWRCVEYLPTCGNGPRTKKSSFSLGRKRMTDVEIQTGLIGKQSIGGNNTGLLWKPLI